MFGTRFVPVARVFVVVLCALTRIPSPAAAQPVAQALAEEAGPVYRTPGLSGGEVVRDLDLRRPLDLVVRLSDLDNLDALVADLDRLRAEAVAAGVAAAAFAGPERLPDGRLRLRVPRGALGAVAAFPYVEDVALAPPFAVSPGREAHDAQAVSVRIQTDRPLPYVLFTNQVTAVETYTAVTPMTLDVEVPPGTYDVLVFYFDVVGFFQARNAAAVFVEDLTISGPVTLDLPSTLAVHEIDLDGVDEAGVLLTARPNDPVSNTVRYFSRHRYVYPEGSAVLFVSAPILVDDRFRVSDLSERFTVLAGETLWDLQTERDLYLVQHAPVVGVEDDRAPANTPADYVEATARLRLPRPGLVALNLVDHVRLLSRTSTTSIGFFAPGVQDRFEIGLHLTPDVDPALSFTVTLSGILQESGALHWATTEPFRAAEGRILSLEQQTPSPATHRAEEGEVLPFGAGPIWPDLFGDGVGGDAQLSALVLARGMLDEARRNDYTASMWRVETAAGSVVAETADPSFVVSGLAPGRYRAVWTDANTLVGNTRGTGVATAVFDTGQADGHAPKLTSLKLLDANGDVVPVLAANEPATLEFSAGDFRHSPENLGLEALALDEAATSVYVRAFDAEAWVPLPHERVLVETGTTFGLGHDPIGSLYRVDLGGLTAAGPGGYDLRIDVADPAGNTFSWVLEPALVVGDFAFPTASERVPVGGALDVAFYPNPAAGAVTIRYALPVAAPVRLAVFDVLGREVARLVEGVQGAGAHTIRFDGAGLPSGLYAVRLSHPSGTTTRAVSLVR